MIMFRITSSTTLEDLLNFLSVTKSLDKTLILCSGCHNTLNRTRKSILGSFAKTGVLFCSVSCRNDYFGSSRVYKEVTCAKCDTMFLKAEVEMRGENDFCSRSCAASFNNHKHPKREKSTLSINPYDVCNCGNNKRASADRCRDCYLKELAESRQSPKERYENTKKAVVSYRQRIKLKAVEYKGGKCVICGYNKCVRSLQFHHVDPSKKDFSLSQVTRQWEKVKSELDKCIIVCANCHGEIHDGMRSDFTSRH